MKIIITAREALDKGIWLELCDLKGINEWAVNEGLMDTNHEITLTEDEARKLGIQVAPPLGNMSSEFEAKSLSYFEQAGLKSVLLKGGTQ